ncbi:MAG: GWxTD domain-containing protein, partial [Acidobacteria bacterium]|nr:GWxTD domain-containing protein [Acidobacteriota bacterium]
KPSAEVDYDIVNSADNKPVVHAVETTDKMGNVGDQLTLEKSVAAANLPPGTYQVTITVKDNVSQQTISKLAKFAVEQ